SDTPEPQRAVNTPTMEPTSTPEPTLVEPPTHAPTAMQPPTALPTHAPTKAPTAIPPTLVPPPADVPVPVSFHASGYKWVPQTWNNCGPANLTQALQPFGWKNDQKE